MDDFPLIPASQQDVRHLGELMGDQMCKLEGNLEKQITGIVERLDKLNGSVLRHEVDIAILKDREARGEKKEDQEFLAGQQAKFWETAGRVVKDYAPSATLVLTIIYLILHARGVF